MRGEGREPSEGGGEAGGGGLRPIGGADRGQGAGRPLQAGMGEGHGGVLAAFLDLLRRYGRASLAGAIGGVIVAVGLISVYETGFSRGHTVGEYKASANHYANEANQEIADQCLGQEQVAMAQCIQEIVEATNEDQRAERDLVAQIDAARWNLGALIIAILGSGLALLGTFLIHETLRTTRDTANEAKKANFAAVAAANEAKEANRIMRSESRPWVFIEQNVMCEFIHQEGGEQCTFWWKYNLVNKGRMPAHNISISWGVYRYDWTFVGAGQQGVADVVSQARRKVSYEIPALFPSESSPRETYGSTYGQRGQSRDHVPLPLCGIHPRPERASAIRHLTGFPTGERGRPLRPSRLPAADDTRERIHPD